MGHFMIQEIIAALAKWVVFEILMIHGIHGWLFNQFLSPYLYRDSGDGGNLDNCCRLSIEILEEVQKTREPFFIAEFRMSGTEFVGDDYGLDKDILPAKTVELCKPNPCLRRHLPENI